ncbi:MAG: phage portal protein [Planctomycetota bacterium]|nr:MAG: phage portal protein [Planctomycetota bacterium]
MSVRGAKRVLGPDGRPVAVAQRRRMARLLRARYDAAVTNDDNRRHWANADNLSADAAANPEVRRTLRNRARYEVANNSYARGIIETLANDVVGTGPRLQLLTADSDLNQTIEREFARWAQAVGLARILRVMRKAKVTDGEAFALFTRNPGLDARVQLDLRLVEADQVSTPNLSILDPNAVDGIVFDEFGNPVEYHLLKSHPGDNDAAFSLEYDRLPAASVIHYYRVDRPGQSRGIPDITPALPLFAQLRRYTLAVIAAAETAADFAAVIYSEMSPDEDTPPEPMDVIELEQRMATVLPAGWKLGQIRAEHPSTTYAEFKKEILNEIARCLNMPFNIAAANSADYNYASGRLDHQTYFKAIRVERDDIEQIVLNRVFREWINEAALIEGYLPRAARVRNADLPVQWFWDGFEHVDPAKEANAQATRLASNTTTLAAEYARQGRDWEIELRQRAREKDLMRELGLTDEQADTFDDGGDAE